MYRRMSFLRFSLEFPFSLLVERIGAWWVAVVLFFTFPKQCCYVCVFFLYSRTGFHFSTSTMDYVCVLVSYCQLNFLFWQLYRLYASLLHVSLPKYCFCWTACRNLVHTREINFELRLNFFLGVSHLHFLWRAPRFCISNLWAWSCVPFCLYLVKYLEECWRAKLSCFLVITSEPYNSLLVIL